MKLAIICIALLFTATVSFCQETKPSQALTKQEYLQKSKSQKTAAWILLGSGVALFAVASPGNASFSTTAVLAVGGIVATLSSIPLFIAAGRNKRKAMNASAYLKFENGLCLQTGTAANTYPAVSITINF
ncbi:MAG: hypothetical protein ABJA37_01725 [Ferruginibacter sp.]